MATASPERSLSSAPGLPGRRAATSTLGMYWRVFAVNAAIMAAAFLLLVLTPVTISRHTTRDQVVILLCGLTAMLAANALLLRLSLSPLRRLTWLMRSVDLVQPERRLRATGSREVAEVIDVFNTTLARLEEERRSAIRRVLTAQESERRRIARELHDQIGQDVMAMLLDAERLQERVGGASAEVLDDMIALAREIMEELRRISYELRPAALDELGLASAIQELCCATARRSGIAVTARVSPLRALEPDAELALYRVVQEALTNAVRHSGADAIDVELRAAHDELRLTVTDNGTGIPPGAVGGGMRGMRERAHMIGATLVIGADGSGTRISLTVGAAV
jgi:two-component system, NarL family, sensor histidine kinase UhpB